MDSKEYFETEKSLEARYKLLAKSVTQARILRKALREYFEILIIVRAHAWCMDVQLEREKMVRLVVGACINILALQDKVDAIGPNKKSIRCLCKKDVIVGLLGGQYPDSYVGRCSCGKGWLLTDWPAKLP